MIELAGDDCGAGEEYGCAYIPGRGKTQGHTSAPSLAATGHRRIHRPWNRAGGPAATLPSTLPRNEEHCGMRAADRCGQHRSGAARRPNSRSKTGLEHSLEKWGWDTPTLYTLEVPKNSARD